MLSMIAFNHIHHHTNDIGFYNNMFDGGFKPGIDLYRMFSYLDVPENIRTYGKYTVQNSLLATGTATEPTALINIYDGYPSIYFRESLFGNDMNRLSYDLTFKVPVGNNDTRNFIGERLLRFNPITRPYRAENGVMPLITNIKEGMADDTDANTESDMFHFNNRLIKGAVGNRRIISDNYQNPVRDGKSSNDMFISGITAHYNKAGRKSKYHFLAENVPYIETKSTSDIQFFNERRGHSDPKYDFREQMKASYDELLVPITEDELEFNVSITRSTKYTLVGSNNYRYGINYRGYLLFKKRVKL